MPSGSGSSAGDSANSSDHDGDSGERQSSLHGHFASVLEQILAASEAHAVSQTDPMWTDLIQVAARHPGAEFCVDPILYELVAVVTKQIRGIAESRRESLGKAVASTLAEDQTSLVRLQHLWGQFQRIIANVG